MRVLYWVLMLLVATLLVACGGATYVPLYTNVVNEAGDVVPTLGGYTKDASIAKEHDVHETLRNRDRMIVKAQQQAGFSVEFDMQEVMPGVFIQVTKKLSYTPMVVFDQALPLAPSNHPVWDASRSWVSTIVKGALGITGITELGSVMKAGLASARPSYGGDYSWQSHNTYPVAEAAPYEPPLGLW